MAGDRGEREALFRGDDHGARDRGQRRRVLALAVVRGELVDLLADDGALVRGLALADSFLEAVPVHSRPRAARFGRFRLRLRAVPGISEHFELHESVDVFGGESGLVELHAELLDAACRDGDHGPYMLTV